MITLADAALHGVKIYLDGHASTPLAPEAKQAMLQAWENTGNPGSPHYAGHCGSACIETARRSLADLIGATPSEIVFTSGATESNNLALLGSARTELKLGGARRRLLISSIEHRSIIEAARALESEGIIVDTVPVLPSGLVDLNALASLLSSDTLLVSIGAANGEIGVLQPIAEISRMARRAGSLVHSDLSQMIGKVAVDVATFDLDFASLSAHKLYGPLGIGALFVALGAPRPTPLTFGGGQEMGLRAGTVAAPLAAGFGAAAEKAIRSMAADTERLTALATLFLGELSAHGLDWTLNGDSRQRVPGSLSLRIKGTSADSIVDRISSVVAISTGSACQSGEITPSHVLSALSLNFHEQKETLRICFGRYNNEEEARLAAGLISEAVRRDALATGGIVQ